MDANQKLYYALGILCYAVANADGKIQKEEKDTVYQIVKQEIGHAINFDYAEIIFKLLERDDNGFLNVYDWALNILRENIAAITPENKVNFVKMLNSVAAAFPPTTQQEQEIISRFEEDVENLWKSSSLIDT